MSSCSHHFNVIIIISVFLAAALAATGWQAYIGLDTTQTFGFSDSDLRSFAALCRVDLAVIQFV